MPSLPSMGMIYCRTQVNTVLLHFYKKIDELVNIFKIFIGILSGENPENMGLCWVGVRSDD